MFSSQAFQICNLKIVLFEDAARGKSQQLRARTSQGVKCKGAHLWRNTSCLHFLPFSETVSKDTVTQMNPLVSLALSQPLRGSAHRHQHSARCLSLSLQHDKLRNRITTEKER